MTLEEAYKKSENGTLTYDELQTILKEGNAKFVDLADGGYVSKGKFEDEISTKDTRITELTDTISQRDTDLADLKAKLENAGTDATKLGQLTTDFASLQSKYDDDIRAYEEKLNNQQYEFAVKEFANSQNFSSNAAKRDFVSSMLAKKLPIENGVLIGATDFVTAYSQENGDAFAQAKQTKPDDKPHFVGGTTPNANSGKPDDSPFHFEFAGVRPHK